MIGLVVVGFDVLPEALLIAMQSQMGKQEHIVAVALAPDETPEDQRKAILQAIESADQEAGVVVFTDSMAAPSGYLTLSIIDQVNIEVVGGVNVPMLCKTIEHRATLNLNKLAELARDEGRKAIVLRSP